MFSTLPKTGTIILASLNLSSANAFSMVKAKVLSFGKELNDSILDWSKLKAFAHERINVNEKLKFGMGRVENVGKGENAGCQ